MLPPCKKCQGLQTQEYVPAMHDYAVKCFICGGRIYPPCMPPIIDWGRIVDEMFRKAGRKPKIMVPHRSKVSPIALAH